MRRRDVLIGPKMQDAMLNNPLSADEQRVLFFFARVSNSMNYAFTSVGYAAQTVGVAESDVESALESLKRRQMIAVFPPGIFRTPQIFFINPEAVFCGDEDLMDEVCEKYAAL